MAPAVDEMNREADCAVGSAEEMWASDPDAQTQVAYVRARAQFLYGWMLRHGVVVNFGSRREESVV